MHRPLIVLLLWSAPLLAVEPSTPTEYRSPYALQLTHSQDELIGDILNGERGKAETLGQTEYPDWYSPATKAKLGAWGPRFKWLAPPTIIAGKSAEWQRERVLAIAARYRGYSYQHHHLPDWDPPADWPWIEVKSGHNGKGIDCSNFTGLVYNLALGVRFSTAINKQATEQSFTVSLDPPVKRPVQVIEKPEYDDCLKTLKPADLLFIANDEDRLAHVVLWVGELGKSSKGGPLILDSTGTGHKDEQGQAIPDGVQLRPFTASGWYFRKLKHIHRIIRD